MPVIHFEAADSPERTRIAERIVEHARRAGRLQTSRPEDEYFIDHKEGYDVGGSRIRTGDEFYFDTETGDILCTDHGRTRREERTE